MHLPISFTISKSAQAKPAVRICEIPEPDRVARYQGNTQPESAARLSDIPSLDRGGPLSRQHNNQNRRGVRPSQAWDALHLVPIRKSEVE